MRRKISAAIVAAGMMVMNSTPVFATVGANVLPQYNSGSLFNNNVNVQTGSGITGTFPDGKPDMNVQIQGGAGSVGTASWNSFDIGSSKHVNFEFTNNNQTSLNRVEAAGGMSQIYGKLTNSCGSNCGYASTGKVILINPNGVLFGTGANVNLNSFTVSTLDGNYTQGADETKGGSLTLKPNTSEAYNGKNKGIIAVENGATIYGDKAVNFAADNRIILYEGSKIKTNTGNNAKYTNGGELAMGNVRLVTADGVTFKYENNGATVNMDKFTASTKEMNIDAQGYIESGKVDIRNYSSHANSELNVFKGTIKAVKAVKGNDGSIWLTANNHVIVDDSNLITSNMEGAEAVDGGNIQILAGQKASVKDSNLTAVGNIKSESVNLNSVIDDSIVTADKNVEIKAAEKASIQKGSKVAGNNITVNGTKEANVLNSAINAQGDITILSDSSISTENSDILTKGNITLTSKGDVSLKKSTFAQEKDEEGNITKRATSVKVSAKNDITDESLADSTFNGDMLVLESTDENIKLGDLSNTQFNSSSKQPTQFKAGKNIEIVKKEGDLNVTKWSFEAGDDIQLQSETGKVKFNKGAVDNFKKGDHIILKAATDITTDTSEEAGAVDLNGIQTTMEAGNNINVKVKGVAEKDKALIAKAENNMSVTAEGDLAVSELISGNNMTLKADNILSGSPKSSTNHYFKEEGDSSADRAYIEVGGTFTTYESARTSDDNAEGKNTFNVTDSTDLTDDGQYNKKHWIEFGKNNDEKVLLVNKRPVDYQKEEPDITAPNRGGIVDPEDPSTAQPGDGNPGPSVKPVDPNPEQGNYEEQYNPNKEYDEDCEKAPGIDEEGSELPEIEDPELPENPSAEEKSPVPPTDENELPMMPLSEISLKNVDSTVNSVGTYTLKLDELKK